MKRHNAKTFARAAVLLALAISGVPSLPEMLTGPNAFEISNIGSQSYLDDQDVTTLHCVERRSMEFLRTTGTPAC